MGNCPETLEPLVGEYLEYMPTDPAGGEPFYYRKDGFNLKQYVKIRNNYEDFRNDSPVLIAFPSNAVPMKFLGKMVSKSYSTGTEPVSTCLGLDFPKGYSHDYRLSELWKIINSGLGSKVKLVIFEEENQQYVGYKYIFLTPEPEKGKEAKKPEEIKLPSEPPKKTDETKKAAISKKPAKASEFREAEKATQEAKVENTGDG